jgi:hypothetical protein
MFILYMNNNFIVYNWDVQFCKSRHRFETVPIWRSVSIGYHIRDEVISVLSLKGDIKCRNGANVARNRLMF